MVRIFWTIKTPDERATTKQACRDESIVSLFFSPIATYIALYSFVSSTVKRKNQYTDFLYIYIYIERLFSYKRYTILLIKSEVLTCDLVRLLE